MEWSWRNNGTVRMRRNFRIKPVKEVKTTPLSSCGYPDSMGITLTIFLRSYV